MGGTCENSIWMVGESLPFSDVTFNGLTRATVSIAGTIGTHCLDHTKTTTVPDALNVRYLHDVAMLSTT